MTGCRTNGCLTMQTWITQHLGSLAILPCPFRVVDSFHCSHGHCSVSHGAATATVPELADSSAIIETAVNLGQNHVSSQPKLTNLAATSNATINTEVNMGESQSFCRQEFRQEFRFIRCKAAERKSMLPWP